MTKQEILDKITFKDYSTESEEISLSHGGLARALFSDVEWFFDEQEGDDYSGDWYMVGKDKEGKYYFFSRSYGSCAECDSLAEALYQKRQEAKQKISEIIDEIQATPILANKEAALEYAKKFDWQNAYNRDINNPFVNLVIKAIEVH